MNKKERIEMVKAMETIARTINDENILEQWRIFGVADGDIDETTKDEELDFYVEEDETFKDLMQLFLILMSSAKKSGGLYCDNIVSK